MKHIKKYLKRNLKHSIVKNEVFKINDLHFYLKKLEKEQIKNRKKQKIINSWSWLNRKKDKQ